MIDINPQRAKLSQWLCSIYRGSLPKGPYLPCVSMAGRALLAGYSRYGVLSINVIWSSQSSKKLSCLYFYSTDLQVMRWWPRTIKCWDIHQHDDDKRGVPCSCGTGYWSVNDAYYTGVIESSTHIWSQHRSRSGTNMIMHTNSLQNTWMY